MINWLHRKWYRYIQAPKCQAPGRYYAKYGLDAGTTIHDPFAA